MQRRVVEEQGAPTPHLPHSWAFVAWMAFGFVGTVAGLIASTGCFWALATPLVLPVGAAAFGGKRAAIATAAGVVAVGLVLGACLAAVR